jgi:hypothetical protein
MNFSVTLADIMTFQNISFPHETPCTSAVQEFVTPALIGRNPQREAVSLLLPL